MSKVPTVYLNHILDAIESIEKHLQGVTKEYFYRSDVLQSFVERKLEILGEAAKNIPETIKIQSSDIPWKDMAGMRDVLIHQYSEVDNNIVWETATHWHA